MERNRKYPKLVYNLHSLIENFDKWYNENTKSEDRKYYDNKINEKYLKSLKKDDFIKFFIDFYDEGGKVQSGGERQLSRFKSMINKNYESFKKFVLQPFSDNFNLNEWLIKIEDNDYYKSFGKGIATIYLNRINDNKFCIINNKTIKALQQIGLDLRGDLVTKYNSVKKLQKYLINQYSQLDNYYQVDALMHYIVEEDKDNILSNIKNKIYHCISIDNNNIYKISHGVEEIPSAAYKEFLENKVIVLHKNTKSLGRDSTSQADYFREANIGDYFYLCRSNKEIVLLGRILSEYEECKSNNMESEGWIQRSYEIVKKAKSNTGYEGNAKSWTPNYNSTFKKIKPEEIELCNEKLFRPYFDITILTKESSKQKINITSTNNKSKEQNNKNLSILELNTSPSEYIDRLYFEDQNLINQIHTALKTGKHIILNGPPGTGKSKLAKEICKHYCDKNYKMTTATSDWSTFDTIGGLMPNNNDGNKLEFTKGIFLECFQDKDDEPDNKWLILDEINRADIDKAFGALFSALTGDKVTLPQKRNGEEIEIIGDVDDDEYYKRIEEENIKDKDNTHKFIIHPDWRIIATMNTFDKASLYEMSYAFMRRFAFINIGLPDIEHIDKKLLNKYITLWNKNDVIKTSSMEGHIDDIAELWKIINSDFRPIGPAIIGDTLRYVSEILNMDNKIRFEEALTDAIAMYVLPQFEGLEENKLKGFTDEIGRLDYIDKKYLGEIIKDFFQIELKSEEENSG